MQPAQRDAPLLAAQLAQIAGDTTAARAAWRDFTQQCPTAIRDYPPARAVAQRLGSLTAADRSRPTSRQVAQRDSPVTPGTSAIVHRRPATSSWTHGDDVVVRGAFRPQTPEPRNGMTDVAESGVRRRQSRVTMPSTVFRSFETLNESPRFRDVPGDRSAQTSRTVFVASQGASDSRRPQRNFS